MVDARNWQDEADFHSMSALARCYRQDYLHVADLPYRFSSWGLDDPQNARLWFAGDELVAWGVLQAPFWSIDIAVQPQDEEVLYPEALAWGVGRARAVQGTRIARPAWFVNVFERQTRRRRLLEQAGFADQANSPVDPWSKVWMAYSSQAARLRPVQKDPADLPPGYRLRPLAGQAEVPAYVALHRQAFETENMTEAWRQRMLLRPEYLPELDLVIEAPDGELAAFCILWRLRAESGTPIWGQVEPMGVHPRHHRRGLGRALLVEGLRRLQALGIQRVYLETDAFRDAAFALYESVGFQVKEKVLVYRKEP
jgi:ribosomal protein S18 acetylase RimI-like enzyme